MQRDPRERYRLVEHVRHHILEDGSAVVLNRRTLEAVELNVSGSTLFQQLLPGAPVSLEALAGTLEATYAVPAPQAQRDALELVDALVAFGVLLPVEGST